MGYPNALIMLMVTIGLLLLRRRAPNLRRPFKIWLPLAYFFIAIQVFLIITPFIRPIDGKGDTSLPYWLPPVTAMIVLVGGFVYWIVSYIALPFYGRFSWIPEETNLGDGTPVIVWAKSTPSGLRIKNRIC
jgi:amino acid transporter